MSKNDKLDNVPVKGHNENIFVHSVEISSWASEEIQTWPREVKKDLGAILTKLQKQEKVGFPDTRYIGIISPGCFEVRILGMDGIYRAFYLLKSDFGIVVFHAFKKKSQKTPRNEIETAKQRLSYFLRELTNEKKA